MRKQRLSPEGSGHRYHGRKADTSAEAELSLLAQDISSSCLEFKNLAYPANSYKNPCWNTGANRFLPRGSRDLIASRDGFKDQRIRAGRESDLHAFRFLLSVVSNPTQVNPVLRGPNGYVSILSSRKARARHFLPGHLKHKQH